MTQVQLQQLRKVYGSEVVAVDDLDLDIASGEFVVLLGPSGCGKTTALQIIAGLEEETAGRVLFSGEDVTRMPPNRRDVAMVFQTYALYPNMTVFDNMAFGLKMRRTSKADIRRLVHEAAAVLDLEAQLDRRPSQLSGGQRQRVALGRAMVRRPRVFLLDEPLSNVDAKLRGEMRIGLKALHQRLQATFIYVTHDQVEAMSMGDRIAVMDHGVLQQFDTPMAIYNRPASLFVAGFIGSPKMNLYRGTLRDGAFSSPELRYAWRDGGPAGTGGEVVLGFRPTDAKLVDADDPGCVMRGQVDFLEPLGSDLLLTLRHGQTLTTVRADPDADIRAGQPIGIAVGEARLHLFEAESGRRLEVRTDRAPEAVGG